MLPPKNLKPIANEVHDLSIVSMELGFPCHNCGNFSLLPIDGGYFAYFRIFGYWIDRYGRYLTNKGLLLERPDIHQFCILNDDFNFIKKIDNIGSEYWGHPKYTEYAPWLEDGRLVAWNDRMYLSSTVCYQEKTGWKAAGLEVQRLDLELDGIRARHFWNSFERGIGGIQKNWLPVPDKPFHYITGTSTHGTQYMDIKTGRVGSAGDLDMSEMYRGNTPLMKVDDGYLAITHKVFNGGECGKTYVNYLIRYDEGLKPTKVSLPFKLTDKPIEFVTTMIEHDGKLLIGVTEMDDTPYIMQFDKAELFNVIGL